MAFSEAREARAQSTIEAHRGPFQLLLTRPHQKRPNFYTTEWLTGTCDKADVLVEAIALLQDPQDMICFVGIVSIPEQASAFVVRKRDVKGSPVGAEGSEGAGGASRPRPQSVPHAS